MKGLTRRQKRAICLAAATMVNEPRFSCCNALETAMQESGLVSMKESNDVIDNFDRLLKTSSQEDPEVEGEEPRWVGYWGRNWGNQRNRRNGWLREGPDLDRDPEVIACRELALLIFAEVW